MGTYHLSLSRAGEEVRRFFVGEDGCLIGRARGADLVLDDAQVAGRHAELRIDDGQLTVKRHDPAGGVTVNGRSVERCALSAGDSVAVGPYEILVHAGKETFGVDENGARAPFEAVNELHSHTIESKDEPRLEQERLAAIGEAVAGITHYMRNILTGIKGGLDLMAHARDKGDWQQISFGLDIAHMSLERFENLVVDLLTYARKGELTREPVCVNGLVREVLETVRPRAERFDVFLTFREGAVSESELDGSQIHRVLLNLVQNAIDACEKAGGTVEVATWQDVREIVIRVRDTGMGIPRENLPKLSQAFFTTKSGRGTGLGLACSYRIVEQHGGQISVASEPGNGATFTVGLPR